MAAADAATVRAGTPAGVLMDRAGRAVARHAIRIAGGRYGRKAVIVCGKGSNGGDGYAAARYLLAEGLGVRCLYISDPAGLSGPAGEHAAASARAGVVMVPFEQRLVAEADVVVDALLGTGLSGPLRTESSEVIEAVNRSGKPVVAADIPSGVDGTTGAVRSAAVRARVTVAMGAEKIGTKVYPGSIHAGDVVVAPIGIKITEASAWAVDDGDVDERLPPREPGGDKRGSGQVVLWAGSDDMPGAALLAVRGALAAGAGYVSLVTTGGAAPIVWSGAPEAVIAPDPGVTVLGGYSLEANKALLDHAGAVAVGPGLGRGADQRALVEAVLGAAEMPVVVDADGLNVLASDPGPLRERMGATVLTPHVRELARLLEVEPAEIVADRPASVRMAARSLDAVVLLKGPGSIVASPNGDIAIATSGGPELATAGTGDVLTGVVAALLARGLDPWVAAWCGAQMHGRAGTMATTASGGRAITASDVAAAISARTSIAASASVSSRG